VKNPEFVDILDAARRIEPYVRRTPVLTCNSIDREFSASVFFKCENFQKVGAFKIRGATNAVFMLEDAAVERGVVTHSSGNHAAALAQAARWRGVKSFVVMPRNTPGVKADAVAGYGAEISFCEPTLAAREEGLASVIEKTGASFIHPYNDPRVIAGQGTAALELCREIPDLDVVITPVGGGGLLSGTAIAVSGICPGASVIGAEPEGADDAYRSFRSRKLMPVSNPSTIADGLLTSLGDLTFSIMLERVKDIVTVGEEAIIAGMRLVWERMKIVIEPSAAVPVGALLTKRDRIPGERIGVILSGGNVDLSRLPF